LRQRDAHRVHLSLNPAYRSVCGRERPAGRSDLLGRRCRRRFGQRGFGVRDELPQPRFVVTDIVGRVIRPNLR
jgi:hypothetical protein